MELKSYSHQELIDEVGKLKKEYEILQEEQGKSLETIKTLIAKISHELKTPLNSIIGFGELIQSRAKDKKLINYSKNILNSSEHMLALIQDIIDVTNTRYKSLELDYSIFSSKNAIEDVIKGVNNSNINSVLIDVDICADYTRFKQLVYNLISNALKFGGDRQIEIISYIEDSYFCFEITDYGEGIKKENFSKIFELFVQVSDNNLKRKSGSGIGLAMCKTIINAHKGVIKVDSVLNKKTTFIFKIPIEFKKN